MTTVLEKDPRRLSRDPGELIRDIDLSLELKDITRAQRLQERLRASWWERLLVVGMFASVVSFLLTTIMLHGTEAMHHPRIVILNYLSFGAMMVTLVAVLENLLSKIATMRKMLFLMDEELNELKKALATAREGDADEAGE